MRRLLAGACAIALAWSCGGESDSEPGSGGSGGSAATDAGLGGAAGAAASAGAAGAAGSGGGGGIGGGGCFLDPPAGAEMPDPIPTYAGTCPALVAGMNSIQSSGGERKFMIALPKDMAAGEKLPVVFLWHWLGGDAKDFYDRGDVQNAIDELRFIAVLPEKKGDVTFTWPMDLLSSDARMQEELKFFDDMLSCVSQAFTINESCVSTVGVSAGALWSAQLAGHRGKHLSSFVSLSGGVGGVTKGWNPPGHAMPAIVLWGGPTDDCAGVLKFESTSKTLENELEKGGHFFLECIHNCGHAEPPFDAPPGTTTYKGMWDFVLDHPYWLKAGESPYLKNGLSPDLPAWCGIGKGSATPRTGACANPSQC